MSSDLELDQQLRTFIETEIDTLLRILQHHVQRAGLASREDALMVASDLLNDVTVEALSHIERFKRVREPTAWLIGIAANLIKRRHSSFSRDQQREPLVRDLYQDTEATLSDEELFDKISHLAVSDPAYDYETQAHITWLLSHVSLQDRNIIQLGILHGLNGELLAQAVNTSQGAARVQLHRALSRLRIALKDYPKETYI